MPESKPFDWIELLRSLPASLLFILIIDWLLLKHLVNLYKFQVEQSDSNSTAVLISILGIVAVNMFVFYMFARVRVLIEKQRNNLPLQKVKIEPSK